MPSYTVHFVTQASYCVTVEADDPDHAIELADEELTSPGGLVYGTHPLGFDMGGEWEPECVTDESGKEVWTEKV